MAKNMEKVESIDVNALDNFSWDDGGGIDFFGEVTTKSEKVEEIPIEETKKGTPEKEKPEEEEEVNLFGDFDEEENKEVSKEETRKEEVETSTSSSDSLKTLEFLKISGALEVSEEDLEEFKSLDEEDQKQVVKDYFEEAVENRFTESIKELPESVKNIVKYAVNGGNITNLLNNMFKNRANGVSEDIDIEEESSQITVVKQKLIEEEYDEDYITSQIEYLKDSGKLKVTASKYFEKYKADKLANESKEVKRLEEERKLNKQRQIDFRKDLAQYVSSNEDIKGFKLSKKDVAEIPEYISAQSIKLQNGTVTSPFYKDFLEAMKDKDKLVVMATLLRNNFDFTSLQKSIGTKVTKTLKENLQNQKATQSIKSNAGSSQTPKRLIDLIG